MKVFFGLALLVLGGFALEFEENDGIHLHEGDINLTPIQKASLDVYGDPTAKPLTRGITSDPTKLWSSLVVHYNVSSELEQSPEAMAAINGAIQEWEERSCLKFVRRTNEKDYIDIFKGSGCWSYVGRVGGRQRLSLASGCWSVGTVAHEFGHAMGFWHEQSRPDRDNYVTIAWENIPEKKRHNFNKYNRTQVDSLGVGYDYVSVMHYGKTAFSNTGKATIIPKDPKAIQLGQRVGLSPMDVKQADLLYKCNGKTTRPVTPAVGFTPPSGPDTCTFDKMGDTCGFDNVDGDDFDWTQRLGKTPSGGTGPQSDHTTGRFGWFMYIETSSPRMAGEQAVLRSKAYPASPERCLHFYYHMYGRHMGKLSVRVSHETKELLSVVGNQNDIWHRADVQIPASSSPYRDHFRVEWGSFPRRGSFLRRFGVISAVGIISTAIQGVIRRL